MCEIVSFIVSPDFLKIFIPSCIAIGVAFYSHKSAVSRQIDEQRRKQRVEYLENAFRSLLMFSNNPNKYEGSANLRNAAISIQFLGTKWQVEQMQELIETLGKSGANFSFDPLLVSLRNELREFLDLGHLDGKVYWTHPIHGQSDDAGLHK